MFSPPGPSPEFLEAFTAALLRWNRTMSLVSRQKPEQVVARLLRQCVDGGQALWGHLVEREWGPEADPGALFYLDLGSGGGLPGLVWHHIFTRVCPDTRTCLVEPREKRAWFLARHGGLAGTPGHAVLDRPWGEGSLASCWDHFPAPGPRSLLIISLKALHLTDDEVLDGLARAWTGPRPRRLLVARYYPGGQKLDPDLAAHLAFPVPGQERDGWCCEGQDLLTWAGSAEQDVSLVLSAYRLAG